MADSTQPTDMPPGHAVGAGDDTGGGRKDDAAAGVLCHYSTAASRAPPRLELKVDAPLLRLIKFTRSVIANAVDVGVSRAEEEDLGEPAKKRMGRRRLGRVPVRSLQLGEHMMVGTDEVDIVAKFLYKKPRKIVCQIRSGHDAFVKINIFWSNIQTMEACFDGVRFDTLRIQVKSWSEQYRADRPPPGRHFQWRRVTDVIPRTFCLQFEKGTLEKSYGKMLYAEPSLIRLTLPPASNVEDEEEAQATNAQQTQIISAAVHVPSVEAVTPSTRMIGATDRGGNFATHELEGTYDPTELAHMHSLYEWTEQ